MQILVRRTSFSSLAGALLFATTVLVGCSSEPASGTTSDEPDASDGRYHPQGNGKAMTEADACTALSNARKTKAHELGDCPATVRPCPSFLRAQFPGSDCSEYDEGTVSGCVDYYAAKTSCESLATAVADCAVAPLSGTLSPGCQ